MQRARSRRPGPLRTSLELHLRDLPRPHFRTQRAGSGVVLDRELARFLAGEISAEQAVANIEAGWEEITEDFGRDSQRTMYKLSLGITN